MARIKGAMMTRKRRNKILKAAKGYWGAKSKHFKMAKQAVMKSGNYAYIGRKQKKRDFRSLWITRISAACKLNGMNYSQFMNGLKKAGINLNRKMLSELAINDAAAFTALTEKAKAATDAAKMNMEILSEQREIEKNYRAIGEWFVSEFQGELPDAVKDVVAAVNASKEKIAQLEAAKRKEETQDEEPQEESGDAKTCSVCGTVSDSNFCPHCGAPMGK